MLAQDPQRELRQGQGQADLPKGVQLGAGESGFNPGKCSRALGPPSEIHFISGVSQSECYPLQ